MRFGWAWAALSLVACDSGTVGGVTISTDVLDFGIVGVGGQDTQELTLANQGSDPVAVLSATLVSGNPDIFAVDRAGAEVIPGNGEAVVLVTFAPVAQQPSNGQLQLRTDWGDGLTFDVALSGSGGPSTADADEDGWSEADGDCDDDDPSRSPGAEEVCDGQDTDCDGVTPAEEADADRDGVMICEDDCDDANGARAPGREEICDGLDNDCDQVVPDDLDLDGDGYTLCDGDCDDGQPLTSPGRAEVCDEIDNDCDGDVDEVDIDGDGHSVCTLAGDCDDHDADAYPVVVSPNGAANGDGTDSKPYDSLATALANLDDTCRTVVLLQGTHADTTAEWASGAVTIRGETGVAGEVELVAPTGERVLRVVAADATLVDLTVTGGDAQEDGGAILVEGGSLHLDNVALVANTSVNDGGAIAAVSSTVTLAGACRFEDNTAQDDGGAMLLDASTLIDDGTTYLDNTGTRGGALYVVGGAMTLDGVVVRGNSATEGGGIAITGAGAFTIERSRIALNSATADGGGIALRDAANSGTIRNNRFLDNAALGGGGGIAVLGYSASGAIVNDTFHGNDGDDGGAAIWVNVTSASGLSVRSNVLQSNDGPSALYAVGGALVTHNTGYLTNSSVHFDGSIVDGGGEPLDATNVVRNPILVAASDDGNPDNDDLALGATSPEIDAGVPLAELDDLDGSTNDRGYTGGPAAP